MEIVLTYLNLFLFAINGICIIGVTQRCNEVKKEQAALRRIMLRLKTRR